jgi:putative ATPase
MSEKNVTDHRPLAEKMRPRTLDDFVGQKEAKEIIRDLIEAKNLSSLILWGPPGSGKTTLARIVAKGTKSNFRSLSAVNAKLEEVRKEINLADKLLKFNNQRTILFIDEIHRFNKAQQDAFLPAVENGTIILIGATTENPSFEVNSPLLSRSRLVLLKPLTTKQILEILKRAKSNHDRGLANYQVKIKVKTLKHIAQLSGGDARTALNILEGLVKTYQNKKRIEHKKAIAKIRKLVRYDKTGEEHYNTISAYIKSIRGSDPNAALHYLARMIDAGEDPKFIARRLVISASEDIGNADPHSLMVATAVFNAVEKVGLPEAGINLAQATTYLASAPKSNASYIGYIKAMKDIKSGAGNTEIPLELRNAVTDLMKDLEYGKNYQYAHDYKDGVAEKMDYLPKDLKNKKYYQPKLIGFEKKIKERLNKIDE